MKEPQDVIWKKLEKLYQGKDSIEEYIKKFNIIAQKLQGSEGELIHYLQKEFHTDFKIFLSYHNMPKKFEDYVI